MDDLWFWFSILILAAWSGLIILFMVEAWTGPETADLRKLLKDVRASRKRLSTLLSDKDKDNG